MSINENYHKINEFLPKEVTLVVVSKMQPLDSVKEVYDIGHRVFAENRVQDLLIKKEELPKDIKWHLIGHLQTNKVKQIISFIDLIQSVDSIRLLEEIQKEAQKIDRKISVLLQVKVAKEETKFGLNLSDLNNIIDCISQQKFPNIIFKGIMGMATNTSDESLITQEFNELYNIYNSFKSQISTFDTLSMGMSSDYKLAISSGSNLVRIGSSIFR